VELVELESEVLDVEVEALDVEEVLESLAL
jgi:hypothetical protein